MTTRHRWQRLDAQHWVHRLLGVQTFLLVLVTMWALAMGLAHGFLWLAVLPAVFVALSGWLTAAWRRERRWAWWVATILTGMRFSGGLLALLGGDVSWVGLLLLVFDGVLLAFLFHPDSFARVKGPAAAAPQWGAARGYVPRN